MWPAVQPCGLFKWCLPAQVPAGASARSRQLQLTARTALQQFMAAMSTGISTACSQRCEHRYLLSSATVHGVRTWLPVMRDVRTGGCCLSCIPGLTFYYCRGPVVTLHTLCVAASFVVGTLQQEHTRP